VQTVSLEAMFRANKQLSRKALAPFVTAGDPNIETTLEVLEAIDRAGASLCELGVPYSDPIADGPVIQSSYTRALAAGMTLDGLFSLAKQATQRVQMPLLAMTSYSLIFRRGIERFVTDAAAAGLVGLVVPDLPIEESDPLDAACREIGVSLVRLVTPTTSPERAEAIARKASGFLYCVAVAGVTGERTALPTGLVERVKWLRTKTDVPILVGFGINSPEQARAVAEVADGVIVGSAVVRHLAAFTTQPRCDVVREIEEYVGQLVAAVTD